MIRPIAPQRFLCEMDKSLRSLERQDKDPGQMAKYLASLLRKGRGEEEIRILAGLGYQPAIHVARILPQPESYRDYNVRDKWRQGYRIEKALEEGGELGRNLGNFAFEWILNKALEHLPQMVPEHRNNILHLLDEYHNSVNIIEQVDDALGRLEIDRLSTPEMSDREYKVTRRIYDFLGMASSFQNKIQSRSKLSDYFLVGNALDVAKEDFGLNLEQVKQDLISLILDRI